MQIAIELKVYNYVLRRNRQILGLSQKELAIMANVSMAFLTDIELLRAPRGKNISDIKTKLHRLADAMEIDFDILFPSDYLAVIEAEKLPRRRPGTFVWVRDVSLENLPPRDEQLLLSFTPEQNVEETVARRLLAEELGNLMASLSPEEAAALEIRFKLGNYSGDDDDNELATYREIADKLSVNSERASAIVAKALAKLRQPIRSRRIRDFLHS